MVKPDIETPLSTQKGHEERRGLGRKLAWWFGWGIAGLAAVLTAAIVFLDTQPGHRFIIDRVANLELKSGLQIDIGRIDGSVYRMATLHDVRLSDPEGVFLEVPRVRLDWRPYSWAYNLLDIRELDLVRGRLIKSPKFLSTNNDRGVLPGFDVRLDNLMAKDLVIEQPVSGRRSVAQLTGKAFVRSGRVLIDVKTKFAGGDKLIALIDAVPDLDRLNIDIDIAAPQGGVLLALSGLDDPFTFRASGNGRWSGWEGAAAARSSGQLVLATKIYANSGDYKVIGQAYPNGPLAGLPQRLSSPAIDILMAGAIDNGRVFRGSLTLVTPALVVNGKGAIGLSDLAFQDFVVSVAGGRRDILSDVAFTGLGGVVELNGRLSNLSADYQFASASLSVAGIDMFRPSLTGTAHRVGNRLTVPLRFRTVRVATQSAELQQLLDGIRLDGTLILENGQLSSTGLETEGTRLKGKFAANGDAQSGKYAITGDAHVTDYAIRNIGLADVQGQLAFTFGKGRTPKLDGNLKAALVRSDNATLDLLAGDNVQATARIEKIPRNPLRFGNARLVGSRVTMSGQGQLLPGGRIVLDGTGSHMRYGDFVVDAELGTGGPLVELALERPVPALSVQDVRLAIAPIDNGLGIDATGQSVLGPFSGTVGVFAQSGRPTRIELGNFKVTDTHVGGELFATRGGITGTLDLAGGGLNGSIAIVPQNMGTRLTADVVAKNAVFSGAVPISIATADIDISAMLSEGSSDIDAAVNAAGISAGSFFIGKIAASGEIRDGIGRVTASVAGRRGSRFELQSLTEFTPERVVFRADGEFSGRRISMPAPARLSRSGDTWTLKPAQVNFGRRAAIIGSGSFGDGETDVKFQMSQLPLSLADIAIADLGLGGTASGVVTYQVESGEAPTGTARLEVTNLSRSGLSLTSLPVDLSVNAALARGALAMRGVLKDDATDFGRFQARISDLPPGNAIGSRLRSGKLFAQLRYNGPADALWRLGGVEGFDFTGPVRIAADMTGTLDDPSVRGTISTDDGGASASGRGDSGQASLESTLSGMQIGNVALRGTFQGSTLTLRQFEGVAKNGGRVSGRGTIDFAGLKGVAMDLRVYAEKALLVDRDDVGAAVTGDIAIVSDGSGGVLRSIGQLQIDSGRFRLGQAVDADELPRIAFREVNRRADEQLRRSRASPWRYDIRALARNNLDVTGLGLDSEWRADIALAGRVDEPRITGKADLVRGGYQFAGRRFELDRGVIRFQGQYPSDPVLDIRAIASVSDINATIRVGGSGQRPEITFASVPSLPEEEVLSQLLFGSSVTDISAPEAVQLASAIAALRGGSGLDPINQLRSAIGLDRLRIISADASTGQGTGVAAGKYVTRRVYAEIVTDGRGYSATNVEYQITRWLSLLGSISTIGRENVNVRVSRDY